MNINALFSEWWARRDLLNSIKTVGYVPQKSNSYPMFYHEQKVILSNFFVGLPARHSVEGL